MAIKLPTKDQWFMFMLLTVLGLGLLNYVININSVTTGQGDIFKPIPDNFFVKAIELFMMAIGAWIFWKLGTGYIGETFNRRAFITLVIITALLGAIYIFVLEPYTSTGHLPVLKLAAAQVQTSVQSFIAP